MASSSTEISNIAISHLGVGKEIANLDTEQSQEAIACRRFYTTARDEVLRDIEWSFTTKFATLALVSSNPTEEWDYSYRVPSDCLKVRRLLSGVRNPGQNSRAPYAIVRDSAGTLIYTDERNAMLEYTLRNEDENQFPADFVMAFSYKLAFYIAPRLTRGDPFKIKNEMRAYYMDHMSKAASQNFNEQTQDRIVESEFIRARETEVDFYIRGLEES